MSKVELIGKIREGEKIIAKFIESNGDRFIFEKENGDRFALGFHRDLDYAIEIADEYKPILEIERMADGKYKINELEGWPKEGKQNQDDE